MRDDPRPTLPALKADHPAADELVAWAEARLAEDDAARVETHLERCPTCRSTAEDLRSFGDLEPSADAWRVGESELEETLATLQERLRHDPVVPPRVSVSPDPPPPAAAHAPRRGDSHKLLWAALLLVAVGWGIWSELRLREERSLNRLTPAFHQLRTDDQTLRSAGLATVAAGRPAFLDLGEHSAELDDLVAEARSFDDPTSSWPLELRRLDARILAWLPAGALPPGAYEIELFDRQRLIATYQFQVAAP